MGALFELDRVTVRRSGKAVLRDLSLQIPDTGVTVLAGPSGSGKSTVLRLCNRLLVPESGTVRFRGEDVAAIEPCALRRRVGMVFQHPTCFAGSVFDNLRVGEALDRDGGAELLDRVALDGSFLDRDARGLSGGEQQRVCLARTLATDPEALLVDEGTSALDGDAASTLERLVRAIADAGRPVLWVTHDERQADRIAANRRELATCRPDGGGPNDDEDDAGGH